MRPEADPSHDIDLARRGCRAAFGRLVVCYHARVYQFLLRRCETAADAEDATQETFLRAWTAIARFDPGARASFTTWLFTIGVRAAASLARTRAADRRAVERHVPREHFRQPSPMMDVSGGLWEVADACLGPDARSVLWLRYAEELTPSQIARVLGRSEVSVRVSLFRSRRALAAKVRALQAAGEPALDGVYLAGVKPALALDSGPSRGDGS